MNDDYNLQRFLSAQDKKFDSVMLELNKGQKNGHWMWYIFPQVKGLGRSPTAEFYSIQSKNEANAYLNHPILGPRLLACTKAVNTHDSLTAEHIFGRPDYLKFRSCMTLFEAITNHESPFSQALKTFYEGEPDKRTLAILETL